MGVVLTQDKKVVAYESRKLKDHEKLYSAYDLELTVVVHTLRVWRHYLLGKQFVLKTDHNSFSSYFKKTDFEGSSI